MSRAQAVVLAGGLAVRMRPLTTAVPKVLLPVAGRPFLDHLLGRLAACGFDEVVLSVGHLGAAVRAHVEHAGAPLRIVFSDEGDHLRGTLGALRLALPLLDERFVVTYGDSYLPFDYGAPLRLLAGHDDADGVMAVFRNEGRWDASNVETDGAFVLRYEKGVRDPRLDHIDYGAMALRRELVAALPDGFRGGLEPLTARLASEGRLRALVATERFFEIGSPEGLAALRAHLGDAG